MFIYSYLILWSITSFLNGCLGFLSQKAFINHYDVLSSNDVRFPPLEAKASKKKRKSKTSSGSGFARVVEKDTEESNDFKAFPALEKTVAETLIPSIPELLHEPGDLTPEIYDRLDQIYGFSRFNEEIFEKQGNQTPLDYLTLEGTSEKQSKMSDEDFLGLLDSATQSDNTSREETRTVIDSISNLSPFSQLRVLHIDPLVIAIDDFFTKEECDRYVEMSTAPSKNKNDSPYQTKSMTVGKDALAKAQRTSTTWFHHFKNVPELMSKASRLLGLNTIDQWEEPQTVRYRRQEKFTWHLDALSPPEATPNLGGQRIATLLVYLSELSESEGGATKFRDLSANGEMLKVQPKKGSALLFFPAAGGIPNAPFDIRTLHCGEAVDKSAEADKWIAQLWLRQSQYDPSAPAGNSHAAAVDAINEYSTKNQ